MSATGTHTASRSRRGYFRLPQALLKPVVFLLSLAPFLWLVFALLSNRLGPNPIEAITDETGEMGLRFLVITLSLTPLRWILKQTWPLRLRRMLGLFAFFYVCVHFLTYLVLDQQLDLRAIIDDLVERPYVLAGTTAFCILLPLAVTSTRGWVKRLGRRWQSLHRWVYIAATASIVHYIWLARGDLIEPFVYLGILLVLFVYRLAKAVR